VDQCFYTGTIIGIRQKALDLMPVPDWYESFFKKYSIPGTCQGMEKRGKKTHNIRTSWVCSKVDTHQTLVVMGTV
jgi:hypothetical protein